MKKRVWVIIILTILAIIWFLMSTFIYVGGCRQVIAYGENRFTGGCKTFGTPCDIPFYYKKSIACDFILTAKNMISLLGPETSIKTCNALNSKDKNKIFNHFNITNCESLANIS